MILHSSPMEQMVFDQLKWIERRRIRILGAVTSHFDRARATAAIKALEPPLQNFDLDSQLDEIMDERGPRAFLRALAFQLEWNEARLVRALLEAFPGGAVRDQILLGARHAGQEAGRHYMADHDRRTLTDMAELYAALARLTYSGLPSDKTFFPSIRPLSDVSIHYRACAHVEAWRAAEADLEFLCDMQREWMDGVLDILSPGIVHVRSASIAKGDEYGRDSFIPGEKYIEI